MPAQVPSAPLVSENTSYSAPAEPQPVSREEPQPLTIPSANPKPADPVPDLNKPNAAQTREATPRTSRYGRVIKDNKHPDFIY